MYPWKFTIFKLHFKEKITWFVSYLLFKVIWSKNTSINLSIIVLWKTIFGKTTIGRDTLLCKSLKSKELILMWKRTQFFLIDFTSILMNCSPPLVGDSWWVSAWNFYKEHDQGLKSKIYIKKIQTILTVLTINIESLCWANFRS